MILDEIPAIHGVGLHAATAPPHGQNYPVLGAEQILRAVLKPSQFEDIAQRTGLKSSTFSHWYYGNSVPRADQLLMVLAAAGYSLHATRLAVTECAA